MELNLTAFQRHFDLNKAGNIDHPDIYLGGNNMFWLNVEAEQKHLNLLCFREPGEVLVCLCGVCLGAWVTYLCSVLKRANRCLLGMKLFSMSISLRLSTGIMYFFSFSYRGGQIETQNSMKLHIHTDCYVVLEVCVFVCVCVCSPRHPCTRTRSQIGRASCRERV